MLALPLPFLTITYATYQVTYSYADIVSSAIPCNGSRLIFLQAIPLDIESQANVMHEFEVSFSLRKSFLF